MKQALTLLQLLIISFSVAAEEPRGVEGKPYNATISKKSEKQQNALIAEVKACANIECVKKIVGKSIKNAGTDVGEVVRSFPDVKFHECNPDFASGVPNGIGCIQKKLHQVSVENGLDAIAKIKVSIFEGGKRAANLDLKLFPVPFGKKVREKCGTPYLTDVYDTCVTDQVDTEVSQFNYLNKNLENAKNIVGNKGTALAACSAKFSSKTCASAWGQHFYTGYNSSSAVGGQALQVSPGDPKGVENGNSTTTTATATVGDENNLKCPSYISQSGCSDEVMNHWRKGKNGEFYFSPEEIHRDAPELNKFISEMRETVYKINKVEFEKEIVKRVTDEAVAKYFESVYLEGHVTGANGTNEDFDLIAQSLKGKLPATGCGEVAKRIDAARGRIPEVKKDDLKNKRDQDKILMARCMSATQARLNTLSSKLGFVDKKGRPIVMTRSVIQQEAIDQLIYKAELKGKKAAKRIDNYTVRRGTEITTEVAALTGQAMIEFLTDLPFVRPLLKEAQSMIDGEGLRSCRGLAAITDMSCREDLREFQEHFTRLNNLSSKFPDLTGPVSSGGKDIPAYDAIASKNPTPPASITDACEPVLGIRALTEADKPHPEELKASSEIRTQNGALVVGRMKTIENLLIKLCNPARREEVTQVALDNPSFIRSFFSCKEPSFGDLSQGQSGKIDENACKERKKYGIVACQYFNEVKNWDEVKTMGGAMFAVFKDVLIIAGGLNPPAIGGKAAAKGAAVGGALGLAGASDDETAVRIYLGSLFCDSGHGSSIKDCKKIFENQKKFEEAYFSPKFKKAFNGAIKGGMLGAMSPEEIISSINSPKALLKIFQDRKIAPEVPAIQGPAPANIGPNP